MVKAMVGYGVPEADICHVITNPQTGKPLDAKTLRKHFREELDTGATMANAKVAESLYNQATKGSGAGAVTAAIFWLKTRARWKEAPQTLEHTGKDGAPIEHADMTPGEFRKIAQQIVDDV